MVNRIDLPAGGEIDRRRPADDLGLHNRGASIVHDLTTASMSRLKSEWQRTFGHPAPLYLRRGLLLLAIGYRRQEKARGGLPLAVKRRLLKEAAAAVPGKRGQPVTRPLLQPGATLVREWRGKQHCAEIRPDGFAYDGKVYGSLSEIARAITGTRWSGPAFFGLRKDPATRVRASP